MNIEELRRRIIAIQAGHDQMFKAFEDLQRVVPEEDHDAFGKAVDCVEGETAIESLVKLAAIVGYWVTMDKIAGNIVETR